MNNKNGSSKPNFKFLQNQPINNPKTPQINSNNNNGKPSTTKEKRITNYRLLLEEKVGALILENTVPLISYKINLYDPLDEQQRKEMKKYLQKKDDGEVVVGGLRDEHINMTNLDEECVLTLVLHANNASDVHLRPS
eukprot:TRINITY_DN863_c0_g1_i3.p1 TRINITY_DN863_c0_g1~~TRINITY_DN863_c0_g1_i3.p1  ORF type:complete len:137 (-),score=22.05 TRINITY_DN863_c0_g1_i3:723-1133(-)